MFRIWTPRTVTQQSKRHSCTLKTLEKTLVSPNFVFFGVFVVKFAFTSDQQPVAKGTSLGAFRMNLNRKAYGARTSVSSHRALLERTDLTPTHWLPAIGRRRWAQ
jgi:hypothetical protein